MEEHLCKFRDFSIKRRVNNAHRLTSQSEIFAKHAYIQRLPILRTWNL